MPHAGSWTIPGTNIRLPDFGITEKISDIFGQSRNVQGGSQLRQGTVFNVGNVPYTYSTTPVRVSPTTTYIPSTGGGYYQTTSQPKQTPPSKTGGGGGSVSGGGGGSPQPSQPSQPTPNPQPPQPTPNPQPPQQYVDPFGRIWSSFDEYVNRVRGQIESGYNDFISRLDQLAGLYPQWQREDITNLETQLKTGIQGLETSKQSSLDKLNLARQDVLQKEQEAKTDIMSQLRQLLKASQMRAGLLGAGWSSATQEVLPAVLSKQAAQSGAQVARGTISNLNQIAQKEIDVKNTFDLAKNELENDFNTKKQAVVDKYRELKQWIETEKANAGFKKAQALAALDEKLFDYAVNEINTMRQNYLQQQQVLQQWALDRLAQLQNYKIQMGQYGNFSPEQLVYQNIQGIEGLTGRIGQQGGWGENIFGSLNPLDLAKKKRELIGYQ